MSNSIAECIRRTFDFRGKSDRRSFVVWALSVGAVLICGILWLAFLFHGINYTEQMKGWNSVFAVSLCALGIFVLLSVIPTLSLCVRRLRSIGWSPFLVLVPLLAILVLLCLGLMAGFANMDGTEPAIPFSTITAVYIGSAVVIAAFLLILATKKGSMTSSAA